MDGWDEDSSTTQKTMLEDLSRMREQTSEKSVVTSVFELVLLSGGETGKSCRIEREMVIGRAMQAQLRLNDDSISRVHARIVPLAGGKYVIEDLDSRNGTTVNGVPVKSQVLSVGDKIRVGERTVLLFTKRDHAESQLTEMQKMESLGRLARGIAHDFNNLFSAMLYNLDFLEGLISKGMIDTEEYRAALLGIRSALGQSTSLTSQLLGFARRGHHEERPIDFSRLVRDVFALIERSVDRSLKLKVEVDDGLVVVGDQSQLQQVLMNLCINARDAMPKGGVLRMRATKQNLARNDLTDMPMLGPGNYLVITVADNGVGMDQQTVKHIFEPFFTTKAPGKGSGLGLALVYGIAKNHGGHVRVETALGVGTTFTVYLPASEAAVSSQVPGISAPLEELVNVEGTILLVDDDELMRSSTERMLRMQGYEVISCADGVRAVEIFTRRHNEISAVLLDLIMPNQSGLETFRALKRIDPRVRVVMISGDPDEREVRLALSEGVIVFLEKPCDSKTLASALSGALEKRIDGKVTQKVRISGLLPPG